jgi:hypothetical protein
MYELDTPVLAEHDRRARPNFGRSGNLGILRIAYLQDDPSDARCVRGKRRQ